MAFAWQGLILNIKNNFYLNNNDFLYKYKPKIKIKLIGFQTLGYMKYKYIYSLQVFYLISHIILS